MKKLDTPSGSEAEDFLNELRERGRASEFELVYRDDPPPKVPNGRPFGAQAIVRHRTTREEKRYDAGGGTSWLTEFFDDLDAGAWDRPEPEPTS